MKQPSGILVAATLGLLSLVWGTTWAAIRIGLTGVPPFTGVALRFGLAAIALFVLARLLRVPLGRTRAERVLWIVNGLLSFCVSYGIVYWSEQWVPSGLACVLWATFPLFVAVLAHVALPDEPLRSATIGGILFGFAGVALIFSEDFAKLGGPGVAFAAGVLLLSPLASAFANVAIKRWGKGLHHLSLTVVPMAIASALMGATAWGVERGRALVWTPASVGALLYLALAGSALTFSLYYWLLSHLPATRVSLIAYTTPVVAVTVGAIFLHEPYTPRTLVGSALVVGGVALCVAPARRARASVAVAIALLVAAPPTRAAETGPLRLPADPAPAGVRALGSLEDLLALTVTDDGATAAAAIGFVEGKHRGSTLRLASPGLTGGTTPLMSANVEGIVRALRFGPAGEGLYAIVARINDKRGTGETSLVRYDPLTLRAARTARVPLSAAGLELSADGAALLVACRDELRVMLVPDLQSPRLFGVLGDNSAVAAVPGGDLALVGQDKSLVLVSLADRQTRDGLPVRERVAVDGPFASIVAAPDGSAALGRLRDGRTLRIELDPLRVEDLGVSSAIAWLGPRASYSPEVPAPPVPAPTAAPTAPPEPPPQAAPSEEAAQAPVEPSAPAPAVETPRETAAPEQELAPPLPVVPAPEPAPPPATERAPEVPPAAEPAPVEVTGRIRGRILGPAAAAVRHVVLYGPDSVIREAARVVPEKDGTWAAGPLDPGAYRVVLDAGGSAAVESDPAFGQVVLRSGAGAQAPDLTVVRVRNP